MASDRRNGAKQPSVAARLIGLARENYTIVVDPTGATYAVPRQGLHLAEPLSGKGGVLAKRLVSAFYDRYGTPPNPTAMQSAVTLLEAQALDDERMPVHLRCARTENGIAVDLGDEAQQVAIVEGGRWTVRRRPPDGVLFRRTRLTGPLPKPSTRGNLDALRPLLHVTDAGWDLIRAWLVMAWLPNIGVPILSITGTQGAGKSVLGRMLVGVVDPSGAPLKSPPQDVKDWQTVANASRVVGIDNISRISEWWSDALCRTVTREGSAKRQLYTDDDLVVTSYQRAVLLTSIDPGALRGDLAERLLPIELRPLRKGRRSEESLEREFRRQLPRILGGLLDLIAEVLANPADPRELPRMADAARVMASVDQALGSDSLGAYNRAQQSLTETVLEGDPVASALLGLLASTGGEWRGTASALQAALAAYGDTRRNWPANARALSARLQRLRPALLDARGIQIRFKRTAAGREVHIRWPDAPPGGGRVKAYAAS